MTSRIDNELGFYQKALSLRANRQQLLASNIANADTPNYKARDIDFASALKRAESGNTAGQALSVSNPRHLQPKGSTGAAGAAALYRIPSQPSIDGNTVDMDIERSQFTDNAIHYQFLLDRVATKAKTLLTAIQAQ